MWGGGGGAEGYFYFVAFNTIFSNSELNTKSFSCKQTEFGRIFSSTTFLTQIFSYSILKVKQCTSRRTQLQQKLQMNVSCYFELILFVCIDVLRRC